MKTNTQTWIKRTVSASLSAAFAAFAAGALLPLSAAQAAEVVGPEVNWKVSLWGKRRAWSEGVEALAQEVAQKTDGKFQIKVFYGEALSKAKENLDGIKLGAFEMAAFCNFYHPGKNPASMVLTMPFMDLSDFRVSRDVRNAVYAHPAVQKEMAHWNAKLYFSNLLPQFEFMGKGTPPNTPQDFKGLRVRAGGGVGQAMEKLGATLTTVPATDVYMSMERGTIDAASLPYTYALAAYKLPEVSDWFTSNLSPGTGDCPLVINNDAFNRLPQAYQQMLMDARPQMHDALVAAYEKMDTKNLPQFRKKLKEVKFNNAQLQAFKDAAGRPVWDAWIDANQAQFDARGLVDLVQTEIKKSKQKYNLK